MDHGAAPGWCAVKLTLDAQTAVYEVSVAIIMFGAGTVVVALGGPTLLSGAVGAAIAALVSFVIRRVVPSPHSRAKDGRIDQLERELAKVSHPARKLDELQTLNQRAVKPHGPRGASRNW
jgi:membrane protein implicated in regulation of membrane protease activity